MASAKAKLASGEVNLDSKLYGKLANSLRVLAADAVQKANSGHPGMPMGMADVATVLFKDFLKFNPKDPKWPDRDRFILSAGHGSMLLYSLLHLTGYKDMTMEQIKNFRQLGSKTAGHPEYGYADGIETTTGPLGQGIANAVGFAIAEQLQQARYGKDIVDNYTYVIAGDGCLMEGISHEAISLAGHLRLNKLIVLFDDNGISIDGPTSLSVSDDQLLRFKASNWNTIQVDGHDVNQVYVALDAARKSDKPTLIACKTTIAFSAPTKAGTSASHGSPLGTEEIAGVRKALNWDYPPFEIPEEVRQEWLAAGQKSTDQYDNWHREFAKLDADKQKEFKRKNSGQLPQNFAEEVNKLKDSYVESKPNWATRKSSGEVLKTLTRLMPELIGGSADLTGSNLTKTDSLKPINADDFSGSYIYYGVREHAMAAAMNGISLYGGFRAFGGTFLVFTDYCRPSIRLSAIMKQPVVYVMTHDSIGLGEDGPTHQPVEHLASLRAMPNVDVFRPCDAVETLECWQLAVETNETPSVLALTRQNTRPLRLSKTNENLCSKGAYVISEASNKDKIDVTIFASGSEVEIAMDAASELSKEGKSVRVVSVPCFERFKLQDSEYQISFMCNSSLKVAIEAGVKQGWERFIGPHGLFIGMDSFGESAPAEALYEHFGITADNAVKQINNILHKKG